MHDSNFVIDESKNGRKKPYLKGDPAGKNLPSFMNNRSMQEGSQWEKELIAVIVECMSRKVTKGLEQELNRLKFLLHSVTWKCRIITFASLQRIKLT